MKRNIQLVTMAVLCLSLIMPVFAGGQNETEETKSESSLTVFTSILPQKYFVEKIGGERVNVNVLVGPGKSPANYEPTPQQVTALGSAKCLFTIGVPFEKAFLPSIESTLGNLTIVDTSAGIEKRKLVAHTHEEGGEDDHNAPDDPHIWLSPRLVKTQAENILNALITLDPAGEDSYRAGYKSLISELDEIDAELEASLTPFAGGTIFVFHPAFGYLLDAYGLQQVAIETGGKEPAPSVLEEIIEHAAEEDVKIIFVQLEFSKAAAQAVAEAIDGAVVTLNPLNPDYINNLRSIADEMKKTFK